MNPLACQHRASSLGLVLIASLAFTGCSLVPKGHGDYDAGLKERGAASWYGEEFHGRLTASGKVYDQHKLTAAHRTLPLGSRVRVMNALNGRHVEVLINDRGPYIDGRIIDLSRAAAEELDMIEIGTSPVTIQVIAGEMPDATGTIVFGSFSLHDKRRAPETREWASAWFPAEWGSRYGDVWITPDRAEQLRIVWGPMRDLRDERRSRRLSQLSDDPPPPAQLQADPMPEEHIEFPAEEQIPISV